MRPIKRTAAEQTEWLAKLADMRALREYRRVMSARWRRKNPYDSEKSKRYRLRCTGQGHLLLSDAGVEHLEIMQVYVSEINRKDIRARRKLRLSGFQLLAA